MDPDQLASEKPADLDLHCFQSTMLQSTVGNESDCRFRGHKLGPIHSWRLIMK